MFFSESDQISIALVDFMSCTFNKTFTTNQFPNHCHFGNPNGISIITRKSCYMNLMTENSFGFFGEKYFSKPMKNNVVLKLEKN